VYVDEDEVHWSDGPLDPPTPDFTEPSAGPSHLSPIAEHYDNEDSLFIADTDGHYNIPCGLPLHPSRVRIPVKILASHYTAVLNGNGTYQGPSRLQRARPGVHLIRRMPSKDAYLNFALYQANQKAYEATFMKNFVSHALHPDQINARFLDDVDARASLGKYFRRVSHQVSIIAKKMAWNAHYRGIHLLASDGKDGAPFLDVNTINPKAASDFGPENIYEVARKMNGSWYRANIEEAQGSICPWGSCTGRPQRRTPRKLASLQVAGYACRATQLPTQSVWF
jgi:hypothetical protein